MTTSESKQEHEFTMDGASIPELIPPKELASLRQEAEDGSDHSQSFQQFLDGLKAVDLPETKLEKAIQFMQQAIAQEGTPHFKDFWEARKLCLDLFKQEINPTVRVHMWTKYSELCREVRRLKEIFDEQSAFAVEQFEVAIQALEEELSRFDAMLQKTKPFAFALFAKSIKAHEEMYQKLQHELDLLNVYATKTNSLRKELIRTDMRIRYKNKFFARLSKVGDQIFPKRKSLIQEVSKLFSQDVDQFIQTTFASELKTTALFDAKEEIKALQSIAKQLTINTETFSHTRQKLSECWDSIQKLVQEQKKAVSEHRAQFKQHLEQFVGELDSLQKSFQEKQISMQAAEEQLEALVGRMRKTELGKQEIRHLREKVRILRDLFGEEDAKAMKAKSQMFEQKEKEQMHKLNELEVRLLGVVGIVESTDLASLQASYDELSKAVQQLGGQKQKKPELEKLIRRLKDSIDEKKEKALLAMPHDRKEALEKLYQVLEERQARRQESKLRIEAMRKAKGSSGLDFTEALKAGEELELERERLEKIELGIEEIEEQIDTLESQ